MSAFTCATFSHPPPRDIRASAGDGSTALPEVARHPAISRRGRPWGTDVSPHDWVDVDVDGAREPELDGLVCANESLALRAHVAATAAGRALHVVGFDATPVASALGLASVAPPVREAARTCLDLLLPRLGSGSPVARGVLLEATLARPDRSVTTFQGSP